MNAGLLPAVVLEPATPARASILWLHGLGADGHDFESLVPHLGLPAELGVRFVFPHAPRRPVTINGGTSMRAWYDITGAVPPREDDAGIRASELALRRLIEHEIAAGIPPARIVLTGFSQGGAIALHTGLRYPEPLAGILALSTYLPLADTLEREAHPANSAIRILMAHGTEDAIIPLPKAQRSREALVRLGYPVDWRLYPMAHILCSEEVADLSTWLIDRLRPEAPQNTRKT
ncbi:MAG: alpha/beta fold hydrolase [Gammaproteobacteria bacterium]|nr:alpha/beta fold hydrolase [Gammaproteobacteria bacterium]